MVKMCVCDGISLLKQQIRNNLVWWFCCQLRDLSLLNLIIRNVKTVKIYHVLKDYIVVELRKNLRMLITSRCRIYNINQIYRCSIKSWWLFIWYLGNVNVNGINLSCVENWRFFTRCRFESIIEFHAACYFIVFFLLW